MGSFVLTENTQKLSIKRQIMGSVPTMDWNMMVSPPVPISLVPPPHSHVLSVDDLKVGDEDSRHHILRHLQALTIPLRAAVRIVNSCFNAPPAISLKAYQVIVTPDTDIILGKHFDRFVAEFVKRCDADSKIVNQVLADLRSVTLKVTPSVHAEAVLMSLATAAEVQVDGMPAPGASLLPVSKSPVYH